MKTESRGNWKICRALISLFALAMVSSCGGPLGGSGEPAGATHDQFLHLCASEVYVESLRSASVDVVAVYQRDGDFYQRIDAGVCRSLIALDGSEGTLLVKVSNLPSEAWVESAEEFAQQPTIVAAETESFEDSVGQGYRYESIGPWTETGLVRVVRVGSGGIGISVVSTSAYDSYVTDPLVLTRIMDSLVEHADEYWAEANAAPDQPPSSPADELFDPLPGSPRAQSESRPPSPQPTLAVPSSSAPIAGNDSQDDSQDEIVRICSDTGNYKNVAPVGSENTVVAVLGDDDNALCLGPALARGELLESATVEVDDAGVILIKLVFTLTGIDLFNGAAFYCYVSAPSPEICPTGRLAILSDGEVVSAPSINSSSFARDDIVISGQVTEDSAADLASSLSAGELTFRPVLLDLGPIT